MTNTVTLDIDAVKRLGSLTRECPGCQGKGVVMGDCDCSGQPDEHMVPCPECKGTLPEPLFPGLRRECSLNVCMGGKLLSGSPDDGTDCPDCDGTGWVPETDPAKVLMAVIEGVIASNLGFGLNLWPKDDDPVHFPYGHVRIWDDSDDAEDYDFERDEHLNSNEPAEIANTALHAAEKAIAARKEG